MRYRADIANLRALAVIPVVLDHLDERLRPGGYAGVDIFFVISGSLITALLARHLEERRFSLLSFYDSRVRRIEPAYAAVALGVSLAALVVLPPGMRLTFGKSLQAASTFFANRYYLSATVYSGAAPDEQFLLHTGLALRGGLSCSIPGSPASGPPAARARLATALDALLAAGKPLLLVAGAGGFPTSGGRCVLRRRFAGAEEAVCDVTRAAFDADSEPWEHGLQSLADGGSAAVPPGALEAWRAALQAYSASWRR